MRILLYGFPKVGKTTSLRYLDKDVYVLDTENGARLLKAIRKDFKVFAVTEFRDITLFLNKYKDLPWLVVDTIDGLVRFIQLQVSQEFGVESISLVEWGKGYGVVKDRVLYILTRLSQISKNIIFVGHADNISTSDASTQIAPTAGHLIGKSINQNITAELYSLTDAIAYVEPGTVVVEPRQRLISGARYTSIVGSFSVEEFYKKLIELVGKTDQVQYDSI